MATTGSKRNRNTDFGPRTELRMRPELVDTLAEKHGIYLRPIDIPPQEVERYKTSGIAGVRVPIDRRCEIIDTSLIQYNVNPPRHAWIENFMPASLDVIICSGKKNFPKKAIDIGLGKILEGLEVRINHDRRLSPQVKYVASLEPIYHTIENYI